jgi:hypothetical protein
MASLKVAVTIVFAHTPVEALGGATEITVGAVRPGTPVCLSGSLHPVAQMSSRNAVNHII